MKRHALTLAALALFGAASTACAGQSQPAPAQPEAAAATESAASPTSADEAQSANASPAPALPTMVVHKSPTCGCCVKWVDHMREAGFTVDVRETTNLRPVKEEAGVPQAKGSCHTAHVGDYFVEGHVPAEDVKRLLAEQPDARGLTLPGMPLGSPGMEVPDGTVQPYTVELVRDDGSTEDFAHHGQ